MKTLDRYILKNFAAVFTGSLVTVAFLFTALSVLDSLTYLMGGKGVSFFAILRYYSLQLPQTIYMTAPISALLSSMITLGAMNQRYEIMAIRAGGVSIARAAVPIIGASIIIAGLLFILGDTLVPYGNRYFLSTKQKLTDEQPDQPQGVWYVSEAKHRPPVILRLDRIDRDTGAIKGFTAFRTGDAFALIEQIAAQKANPQDQSGWVLHNVNTRTFHQLDVPKLEHQDQMVLDLPDTTADVLRVQRSPEEMTISQLSEQIKRIHRYGLPDHAYRVERQARFAIPLAAIILVLVGSPLAIRPVRTTGLAVSILGAVMVGFAYYVVIAEFISLGRGGLVAPTTAAWTANVIFGVAGLGLFSGMRK